MNAHEFVAHARKHSFTAVQVQRHFPQLPIAICEGLLTGVATIDHIKPDGSVVVDDGQVQLYIVVITCAGHRFCTEAMSRDAATRVLADFRVRNPTIPSTCVEIEEV